MINNKTDGFVIYLFCWPGKTSGKKEDSTEGSTEVNKIHIQNISKKDAVYINNLHYILSIPYYTIYMKQWLILEILLFILKHLVQII